MKSALSNHDLGAQLTEVTRDMMMIRSTESYPDERKRCFQFIRIQLESTPDITVRSYESNGFESMVVMPQGIEQPEILFCGHIDVIEHPRLKLYESSVEDGRIYGPGSGDMKGAVAIMLELFCDLQRRLPGISLGLAITSDEERGGENGVRYLADEVGLRCSQVIVPDGGSLTELTIEEKGILHLRLQSEGVAAHAARPWLGDNALASLLHNLARIGHYFDQFKPEDYDNPGGPDEHWFPTCAVTGVYTRNTTMNRIPPHAEAILDIRFPPATARAMVKELEDILDDEVTLETVVSAEPTHLAPDPLFVEATAAETGEEVRLVQACGGSDSRFLRAYDIGVNLSRPHVGTLHGEREWIDIESMVSYYRICERYILRRLGYTSKDPAV